jgi:hypothetical protein
VILESVGEAEEFEFAVEGVPAFLGFGPSIVWVLFEIINPIRAER